LEADGGSFAVSPSRLHNGNARWRVSIKRVNIGHGLRFRREMLNALVSVAAGVVGVVVAGRECGVWEEKRN
jgi:hypothetical protein